MGREMDTAAIFNSFSAFVGKVLFGGPLETMLE